MTNGIQTNVKFKPRPPQFSLRTMLLAITVLSVFIGGCAYVCRWLVTPRVHEQVVREFISTSLPIGTPKEDVQRWLVGRYEYRNEFQDDRGRDVIECRVGGSGLPLGLFPDDIRIKFIFDHNARLLKSTAVTESRF